MQKKPLFKGVLFRIPEKFSHVAGIMIILFSLSLGMWANNDNSQNTKVNLNLKNASLSDVFKEIEKQSEFRFFYNNDVMNTNKSITMNAKEKNVSEVLNEVFMGTDMEYKLVNNYIVIIPKGSDAELITKQVSKPIRVTGTIIDENGEPLTGVSILVKNTTTGVVSDIDGHYTIDVPSAESVLVFSFIGFLSQEHAVKNNTVLNITLAENAQLLGDVIVVGYGTMEKRAVTSSITSLNSKDLVQGIGGASIATALQGKVTGLVISGTSSPNSSNGIQLRGVGSVNAGQEPLVVIDGIPGGDIRSVNQEDILSVDVLKDASAGAIYGTRAAAGVILITTRQGQSNPDGRVKFTYTGEFSTESIRKKPEVLSAKEYVEYGRGDDYGSDTNWYNELVRSTPFSHRQVFNITGGSKYSDIFLTLTTQDQKGIVINDERKDYSARINANFRFLDNFLEIKTHASYRQADRTDHKPNFNQALKANPTRTAYDPNSITGTGYNIWLGGWEDFNALAESNLKNNGGMDKWIAGDLTVKLNLLPELSVQSTFGYQNRQWDYHEYTSRWTKEMQEAGRTGKGKLGFDKRDDISLDLYGNYIKSFDKHSINATAGYSFFQTNRQYWNMVNYNFPVDAIDVWDMGAGTYLSDGEASMESKKEPRERLMAFFGRVNYSYDDRYMASASIRHEGSSKFGPNNRWGNFWSLSGGWRISAEPFMKDITAINDLKLRVAYGVTGNNGFAAGKSTLMYSSDQWWLIGGDWVKTFGSSHNVNPDLKWEEKREWNFGLDYSLLDNRLYGKFDLYRRNVNGMLFDVRVPQPPYTHEFMTANVGDLQNRGWEFELGADIVRSKNNGFSYSSTIRLSNNSTKIKTLWGNSTFMDKKGFPGPGSPGDAIRLQAGSTIGKYYIWRFAGFDDDGNWLLYDKNNNVIPANQKKNEDKAYVGDAMPKLIVSWDHTFTYKNWDLSIFLRSWIDFDVFNGIDMYYGLSNVKEINVLRDAYDKYKHIKGEKELCDYWLDDGTFLKIDAINLGYNLNLKKYSKYLDNARFYLTVRDVATFTKYGGLNPEIDINGLEPGFEMPNDIYPQTRRYTLGVQLSF